MAKATRTINPLHFEDLEPHRFEDLVRQLIYDFREWRSLEATGRLGSDEGFDVRGWEANAGGVKDEEEDEETDAAPEKQDEDRIWLIQCKREKSITPKKLTGYLDEIELDKGEPLHGLIFVAACDFSKKTRDDFRKWCVTHDIHEHYLWGRAELEDLLFQTKYDHLLFAYFGISLQIRRRSVRTRLRGLLAMKRQAIRHLGGVSDYARQEVLLRDPDATEYPHKGEIADFDIHPKWCVYDFVGHYHSGLKFIIRMHFAYVDEEGKQWDYNEGIKTNHHYDDPWAIKQDHALEIKVRHYWNKLPESKRGTLEVIGLIPYEDILTIDEHGDEYFQRPHVYVRFDQEHGPFSGGAYAKVVTYAPTRKSYHIRMEDRVKYFPTTYPEVEKGGEGKEVSGT